MDKSKEIQLEKDSNQGDLCLKNEDPFEGLFKKAVGAISRRYRAGNIEYIREHHRSLYEQTDQAEDQLNEVWKAGLKGEATLEEFRGTLIKWYSLHIKGIEIYEWRREQEAFNTDTTQGRQAEINVQ
jgi:hypothetical protein